LKYHWKLSGKIKRMMALTGALVHGCRACILYQTEEALTLGGTMGAGETTRVVQFLEEKRLLEELKKDN
jgi:hypothetical protein